MDKETRDRLFEELFPLPADRPRRKLRFGDLPEASRLSSPDLLLDSQAPQPPFQIEWRDPDLGLRFEVRDENGEIVAIVEGDSPEHVGDVVSLSLVGTERNEQIRRKIRLESGAAGGCWGRGVFGKLEELSQTLGEVVQPTHFLIEEQGS